MQCLFLFYFLLILPQDKIKKDIPPNFKQNQAADKSGNRTRPFVSTNAPNNQPAPQPDSDKHEKKSEAETYRIEVAPQPSDGWFKAYVIATGIIAALTLGMLIAIWLQTKVMGNQLTEMRTAREQTVKEMQDAGIQTGHLISQAQQQVGALTKAADATEKSAQAAKATADSIINSERAWIFLDIALIGSKVEQITVGGTESTGIHISYRCRNVGKTPAWITAKCLLFKIFDSDSPPRVPDVESLGRFEYGPVPLYAGDESNSEPSWETPGRPGYGKFTLVLGVVKYLDIFGKERVAICGYKLSPDEKRLERIPGSEYNQYT